MHLLDRFLSARVKAALFSEGWGDESALVGASLMSHLCPEVRPLEVRWARPSEQGRRLVVDGFFDSPCPLLPKEVRQGYLRRISAKPGPSRGACVILAASRDEGYFIRSWLFAPLAEQGVDVFLLENPYYGVRRALGQRGPHVRTVSDQLTMNLATIEEARSFVAFAKAQGYERVAVAGYSMGGFMAALTAATLPMPVGVAALAAGASPAPVFTKGAHSRSVNFRALSLTTSEGEARARLANILDAASARTLPPPPQPDAAIIVACAKDGFVPIAEAEALHAHWAGSELRIIDAGHISAVFTEGPALRRAIRDALDRVRV
ncbi:alpha/beta hydrolase family protein [Myxococcus stipitatus]|uniref:alpha/beta fold hydrolase n=1 Tax=Myxococcus stipitatus TaxID=83455 RepID=UPI001F170EF7|nr:alpha/beta fold hydrolase [Myxococcus stipitatus]MCE9673505.1 alpha/beta hydrolase family protein [Myxococcus stipitatus]